MLISTKAQAGTMQSSDLIVFAEPAQELVVEIESTVQQQFGHLIRERVDAVLKRLKVESGRIAVADRGALDYAIEARVEAAVRRAAAS
jgi:citrate lyase subunit gamma (acyl carrier protein)